MTTVVLPSSICCSDLWVAVWRVPTLQNPSDWRSSTRPGRSSRKSAALRYAGSGATRACSRFDGLRDSLLCFRITSTVPRSGWSSLAGTSPWVKRREHVFWRGGEVAESSAFISSLGPLEAWDQHRSGWHHQTHDPRPGVWGRLSSAAVSHREGPRLLPWLLRPLLHGERLPLQDACEGPFCPLGAWDKGPLSGQSFTMSPPNVPFSRSVSCRFSTCSRRTVWGWRCADLSWRSSSGTNHLRDQSLKSAKWRCVFLKV